MKFNNTSAKLNHVDIAGPEIHPETRRQENGCNIGIANAAQARRKYAHQTLRTLSCRGQQPLKWHKT